MFPCLDKGPKYTFIINNIRSAGLVMGSVVARGAGQAGSLVEDHNLHHYWRMLGKEQSWSRRGRS